MKRMKKVLAVLLAAIMVMSMGTSVFADDTEYKITITNANSGEIYTAYKILDVTYSGDAYSYTISADSAWYSIISDAKDSSDNSLFTLTASASDSSTYVVQATSYCTDDAVTYYFNTVTIPDNATTAASETATAESVTLDVTSSGAGYYFVTTSTGSLVTVNTAAPTATVEDKNTAPSVEKTVSDTGNEDYDKTNTAGIGDTVYFKAVISHINDASNIKFHDTMSTGLTFGGVTSVVYSSNGTDTTATLTVSSNYTVTTASLADDCTFEIDFSNYLSGVSTLTDSSTLTIYYTATVNSNAVIEGSGNTNTAKVSYGNASTSTESTTTTYVYELNIYKYTDTDTALSGASFVLYKDVDGTKYYAVVANGKLTGWTTYLTSSDIGYTVGSDSLATTLTSDSNGMIYIDGLDAGEYYLLETEAPSGYNLLTSAIKVTIAAGDENAESLTYGTDNDSGASMTVGSNTVYNIVKVENNSGSTIPTTGGIGTTIFYVVGAVLVIGAAVILITRRRMGNRT